MYLLFVFAAGFPICVTLSISWGFGWEPPVAQRTWGSDPHLSVWDVPRPRMSLAGCTNSVLHMQQHQFVSRLLIHSGFLQDPKWTPSFLINGPFIFPWLSVFSSVNVFLMQSLWQSFPMSLAQDSLSQWESVSQTKIPVFLRCIRLKPAWHRRGY